jgi:hypothetical protein
LAEFGGIWRKRTLNIAQYGLQEPLKCS